MTEENNIKKILDWVALIQCKLIAVHGNIDTVRNMPLKNLRKAIKQSCDNDFMQLCKAIENDCKRIIKKFRFFIEKDLVDTVWGDFMWKRLPRSCVTFEDSKSDSFIAWCSKPLDWLCRSKYRQEREKSETVYFDPRSGKGFEDGKAIDVRGQVTDSPDPLIEPGTFINHTETQKVIISYLPKINNNAEKKLTFFCRIILGDDNDTLLETCCGQTLEQACRIIQNFSKSLMTQTEFMEMIEEQITREGSKSIFFDGVKIASQNGKQRIGHNIREVKRSLEPFLPEMRKKCNYTFFNRILLEDSEEQ